MNCETIFVALRGLNPKITSGFYFGIDQLTCRDMEVYLNPKDVEIVEKNCSKGHTALGNQEAVYALN